MRIHALLIIVVAALVTAAIRFLPFLIFDRNNQTPKWLIYIGDVMPPAVMSFLLVYCLKSVNLLKGNHGLPEIICVAVAMGLHAWKRNTLLSIVVSTVLYMFLVQSAILG